MKILSVSELTSAVKAFLEPHFRNLSVRGEISNLKLQSSGHFYFSLKDRESQVSAVLFRGNAASLSRPPKEGDEVVVKGEISLYAPRGQYQLIVREMEFAGLGQLLLQFHQRKEAFKERGWFDEARKKPLPKMPRRIGVVTSPTGAVIQDILNVLGRRFSGVHVLLNPVKVQGEGAAVEIAAAIAEFNKHRLADVLIVGRGGGSIEDLWAFNEEIVAKAIFDSEIPIISAVGHETDFTIADWVSDLRAPTPSAAAEIVISEKSQLLKTLSHVKQGVRNRVLFQVQTSRQHFSALKRHPLLSSPYTLLAQAIQQLDDIRARLELLKPSSQIAHLRERLTPYSDRFKTATLQLVLEKKERLRRISQHLASLNPRNLLQKGYAIVFSGNDRSVILSAKQVSPEESLNILLHDGLIAATANRADHDARNHFF